MRAGQSGAGMILHPATAQSLVYPTRKRPPVRRLTPFDQLPLDLPKVEAHLRQRLGEFIQSREAQS